MAKQNINIGSSANKGDGDPLRTAFTKINSNFTELYDAIGLGDGSVNLGSLEFNGSTITTTDSSRIEIAQEVRITSDLTMRGSIVPNIDNRFDLGTPDNQWRSLYVSNDTIFIGGVPLSVETGTNELKVNNVPISQNITYSDIPNAPTDVADLTDADGLLGGGGAGPVQPYLELTDSPFIIQPAVLGTPVTVTAAPWSDNARFTVVIGAGPSIDSITVTTAGTDYVVGQRYRIEYWQIGGGSDAGSIDFEVDTVGANGELLTVTDAAFAGAATNTPGTYTDTSSLYQPSVFDEIDTGLTLTRGRIRGIFNIELEQAYDSNTDLSPLGTEWNSDGWGDLVGLNTRTYTTWRLALNNQVGNNILGAELVMHDIANDKYYKFDFTQWGGEDGGFAYTRTLVEDPNYFRKLDYATVNNVDVIENDSTLQIGITRGNNNGIYNPFTEQGWVQNTSPEGTLWNIDGWDDLTDLTERTYDNLYAAFGGNQLGAKIVGTECVMSVPSIDKYYAVKFLSWTQNNAGGGFSYTRREIDQTKLNQGVKFADGTVQTTAYIPTNVLSTAPNNRRIETASGYKSVSVTSRILRNLTTTASRNSDGADRIWIDSTVTTIDEILNDTTAAGIIDNTTIEFSLDNTTWYKRGNGTFSDGDERGFVVNLNGDTLTYSQGDTVYFRYVGGGAAQVWWDKADLPSGASDFRGAIIEYHAYTTHGTIVGTIHIIDDDGDEYITHTEVSSADNNDSMYDNLWIVTNEGEIKYARLDGQAKTLRIHWTARVFYGSDYSND